MNEATIRNMTVAERARFLSAEAELIELAQVELIDDIAELMVGLESHQTTGIVAATEIESHPLHPVREMLDNDRELAQAEVRDTYEEAATDIDPLVDYVDRSLGNDDDVQADFEAELAEAAQGLLDEAPDQIEHLTARIADLRDALEFVQQQLAEQQDQWRNRGRRVERARR